MVGDVFQAHNTSIPAELHGLTGEAALKKFDQTICEMIKKRNALHHVKRSREKTLSHLEMQISHMDMEEEMILSTPAGDSEEAKQLRQLENRLDKAVIKNNEASHIRKTYEIILQKLQEVSQGLDYTIIVASSLLYYSCVSFVLDETVCILVCRRGWDLTGRLLILRRPSKREARI